MSLVVRKAVNYNVDKSRNPEGVGLAWDQTSLLFSAACKVLQAKFTQKYIAMLVFDKIQANNTTLMVLDSDLCSCMVFLYQNFLQTEKKHAKIAF